MEMIQHLISPNHKDAMFFDGVIATGTAHDGKQYVLMTASIPQIIFNEKEYSGAQIRQLGIDGFINDADVEDETDVTIFVDGWLAIAEVTENGYEDVLHAENPDESKIFSDIEAGIMGFDNFLNSL